MCMHWIFMFLSNVHALNLCGSVQRACTEPLWLRPTCMHWIFKFLSNVHALNLCGSVQRACKFDKPLKVCRTLTKRRTALFKLVKMRESSRTQTFDRTSELNNCLQLYGHTLRHTFMQYYSYTVVYSAYSTFELGNLKIHNHRVWLKQCNSYSVTHTGSYSVTNTAWLI